MDPADRGLIFSPSGLFPYIVSCEQFLRKYADFVLYI